MRMPNRLEPEPEIEVVATMEDPDSGTVWRLASVPPEWAAHQLMRNSYALKYRIVNWLATRMDGSASPARETEVILNPIFRVNGEVVDGTQRLAAQVRSWSTTRYLIVDAFDEEVVP